MMTAVQFPETVVVFTICGTEYSAEIAYCDESITCASDDGESLQRVA